MRIAQLPALAGESFRLGPVTGHWYAVCVAGGVLAALWLTERRYRAAGGRPGFAADLALLAVPVAIAGGRAQRVLLDESLRHQAGQDWVVFLRISQGGIGLPGALLAVAPLVWWWCRHRRVPIGPLLAAAAPGLALGHAIFVWGSWLTRQWYGRPSSLPWAVQISPLLRVPGYQTYAAFQPLFGYESAWDLLMAAVLIVVIGRLALPGDRALALAVGLIATGWFWVSLVFGAPPRLGGSWSELAVAFCVMAAAAGYLLLSGEQRDSERLPGPLGRLGARIGARPAPERT